jgi:hypothetical protein
VYFLDSVHNEFGSGSGGFDFAALAEFAQAAQRKDADLAFAMCKTFDSAVANQFSVINETTLIPLTGKKLKAYELVSPGSSTAFDRLVKTEMLLRGDVSFGPSNGFHSEMQFHWDTVTQAQSVVFFETPSCTKGIPGPASAVEGRAPSGEQSELIDVMHLAQRSLERKQHNAFVFVELEDGTQNVMPDLLPNVESSAYHHGGETCDAICEPKGFASLPTDSGIVGTKAWLRFVNTTISNRGFQNCDTFAARSKDLMVVAISAGAFSTTCPPDIRLCKCRQSSKLEKRWRLWQSIHKLNAALVQRNQQIATSLPLEAATVLPATAA